MSGFRKLSERLVHRGHTISLAIGNFRDPSGHEHEREVVHHPGAVGMVALLDDHKTVILVRQYRSALEAELLEVPAGKRDVKGESPEVTAARELEEEIGYRPGRLIKLAEFFTSPGFCDERAIVYLALDLQPGKAAPEGPEETHMTIEKISLDDFDAMVADGRLCDAKTIIGLSLTRSYLAEVAMNDRPGAVS